MGCEFLFVYFRGAGFLTSRMSPCQFATTRQGPRPQRRSYHFPQIYLWHVPILVHVHRDVAYLVLKLRYCLIWRISLEQSFVPTPILNLYDNSPLLVSNSIFFILLSLICTFFCLHDSICYTFILLMQYLPYGIMDNPLHHMHHYKLIYSFILLS